MKMWIETERTPYVNKTYLEQFKDSILSTDLSNSYRDSISLAPYTNSIFCLNMKNIILANQILANQKKKKNFFAAFRATSITPKSWPPNKNSVV